MSGNLTQRNAGQTLIRHVLSEFLNLSSYKILLALKSSYNGPVNKVMTIQGDPYFMQLISSISLLCKNCLPSVLVSIQSWYRSQVTESTSEIDETDEKRNHLTKCIYCVVLTDILAQLSLHPCCLEVVDEIIREAFKHFQYSENYIPFDTQDANIIAEMFSEVIGVVCDSRLYTVRAKFTEEFSRLRQSELTPLVAQNLVSLFHGIRHFKIKLQSLDEFIHGVNFLTEIGNYFLEVKDRNIRHAISSLLVDLLHQIAPKIKNSVNVPVMKKFVELLYEPTLYLATKKRSFNNAFFPMAACLLSVSYKDFFLANWPNFLSICLTNLKNKDGKKRRIALEAIYRLTWVYTTRINYENNVTARARLISISSSLFPRSGKIIVPKDVPTAIFVKIIQFIAHGKLEYALTEIIYDLLQVNRNIRYIYPERMLVGICAFLGIAENRQSESVCFTSKGLSSMICKCTKKRKLTEDFTTDSSELHPFLQPITRAFAAILRLCDAQVGQPLHRSKGESSFKESDNIVEKNLKLNLFSTCIAAIPRFFGADHEYIEFLANQIFHANEEVKAASFESLQAIAINYPDSIPVVVQKSVDAVVNVSVDISHFIIYDEVANRIIWFLKQAKSSVDLDFAFLDSVEGIALFLLCLPSNSSKQLGCQLLSATHDVAVNLRESLKQLMDAKLTDVLPSFLSETFGYANVSQLYCCGGELSWLIHTCQFFTTLSMFRRQDYSDQIWDAQSLWIQLYSQLLCSMFALDSILHSSITVNTVYILHNRLIFLNMGSHSSNISKTETVTSTFFRSSFTRKYAQAFVTVWNSFSTIYCTLIRDSHELPDDKSDNLQSSSSINLSSLSSKQLLNLFVSSLRGESCEMAECAISALGRLSLHESFDLVSELAPLMRECLDKKVEKSSRRKRKLQIISNAMRTLIQMCKGDYFATRISLGKTDFLPLVVDFAVALSSVFYFLDCNPSSHYEQKVLFLTFLTAFVDQIPYSMRPGVMSHSTRVELFEFVNEWRGVASSDNLMESNSTGKNSLTHLDGSLTKLCDDVVIRLITCGSIMDPEELIRQYLPFLVTPQSNPVINRRLFSALIEGEVQHLPHILRHLYSSPMQTSILWYPFFGPIAVHCEPPIQFEFFLFSLVCSTFPNKDLQILSTKIIREISQPEDCDLTFITDPQLGSFARKCPHLTFDVVSDLIDRLIYADFSLIPSICRVMLPWLEYVRLVPCVDSRIDYPTEFVINNLMHITLKFVDSVPDQLGLLWSALSSPHNNFEVIYDRIKVLAVVAPKAFLAVTNRILMWIGSSDLSVTERIKKDLTASSCINSVFSLSHSVPYYSVVHDDYISMKLESQCLEEFDHESFNLKETCQHNAVFVNLTEHFPTEPVSLYHFPLCFAALFVWEELIMSLRDDLFLQLIPLLVHIAIQGLDNPSEFILSSCKLILHQILLLRLSHYYFRAYFVSELPSPTDATTRVLSMLNLGPLWTYCTCSREKCCSGHLSAFVVDICATVEGLPDFAAQWGSVCLDFAFSGEHHFAIRSLQIFKCLGIPIDRDLLGRFLCCVEGITEEHSSEISKHFLSQLMSTMLSSIQLIDCPSEDIYSLICAVGASFLMSNVFYSSGLRLIQEVVQVLGQLQMDVFRNSFTGLIFSRFDGILPYLLVGIYSDDERSALCADLLTEVVPFHNEFFFYKKCRENLSLLILTVIPFLARHYSKPSHQSISLARAIIEVTKGSPTSDKLITVLDRYVSRSFGKSCAVWIQCVVKYVLDFLPIPSTDSVDLLCRIVDKSSPGYPPLALQTLVSLTELHDQVLDNHETVHQLSFTSISSIQAMRQTQNLCNGAASMSLMKLIVDKSSFLPEDSFIELDGYDTVYRKAFRRVQSIVGSEIGCSLPGRVLEFDMSKSDNSKYSDMLVPSSQFIYSADCFHSNLSHLILTLGFTPKNPKSYEDVPRPEPFAQEDPSSSKNGTMMSSNSESSNYCISKAFKFLYGSHLEEDWNPQEEENNEDEPVGSSSHLDIMENNEDESDAQSKSSSFSFYQTRNFSTVRDYSDEANTSDQSVTNPSKPLHGDSNLYISNVFLFYRKRIQKSLISLIEYFSTFLQSHPQCYTASATAHLSSMNESLKQLLTMFDTSTFKWPFVCYFSLNAENDPNCDKYIPNKLQFRIIQMRRSKDNFESTWNRLPPLSNPSSFVNIHSFLTLLYSVMVLIESYQNLVQSANSILQSEGCVDATDVVQQLQNYCKGILPTPQTELGTEGHSAHIGSLLANNKYAEALELLEHTKLKIDDFGLLTDDLLEILSYILIRHLGKGDGVARLVMICDFSDLQWLHSVLMNFYTCFV